MTLAFALIFFGILLMYCGLKGHSVQQALLGHAVAGGTGQVAGA